MLNKLYVLGLALTGSALAATAYFIRHNARREAVLQHNENLRTWEGEGGKPAPAAARPAQAV